MGERRTMRRLTAALTIGLATLALAACSSFSTPPETFNLSAPTDVGARGSSRAQLLIPSPTALATLDTTAIVVSVDGRYAYYPDAQWPDDLPVLIQARLIESFENSERLRAVGRPGEGLSIDYSLLIDVRAFGFAANTGEGEVEIGARLMNDRNGSVIATQTFRARVPAAADAAGSVVAAIDAAFDEVAVALVDWTLTRI